MGAALLHAGWNFVLKKSGGGLGILTLSSIIGSIVLTPIGIGLMIAQSYSFTLAAFGMVVGSALIHLAYFLLLDRAYRAGGNLSVVYPLARATGPLLTILAATLLFGERMTPLAMGGALLILLAAMVLTGDPRHIFKKGSGGAAGFALLCGGTIAAYTLWDKQAVAWLLIPPVIFDWGAGLTRCLMLTPLTMQRAPGAIAKAWAGQRRAAIAIGLMSPLSYILVLTAMVNTPVAYVAPAREVSILFAALLGAHVLKEDDGLKRGLAAAAMVLGVGALAVG
jgi:drug/metabolite transporter (DMT)-like permease